MQTTTWTAVMAVALSATFCLPTNAAQDREATGIGSKRVKVIVIDFDPLLQTKGNVRLSQFMKWSDPRMLTRKMVEDVAQTSGGYVQYEVIDVIEYDGYPTKRSGYTYDETTFLEVLLKNHSKAVGGTVGFAHLFQQFNLAERIKKENIGEIWLWGAPWFDWDELHWKTAGDKIPYQTDNPWFYRPYDIPDLGRTVWVMGWNYERGEGEMLESYCHRIESVLSLTVGKGIWEQKHNSDNVWNRFTRVDKDLPGESEVGSVHYAPNSKGDYDWSNMISVWTYADDWLTYPRLPRKRQQLNAETGGWKGIIGHHLWWMRHIPKSPGTTDGFYNNWWQYIANYDEAVAKLPPPAATFMKAKAARYGD